MTFSFKDVEDKIQKFWDSKEIYKKAKKQASKSKKIFRFIDGPPYASGAIHLGTAWNKSMKDMILRYKRMTGFNPNDQPGFDCHGLPIEVQVEKRLGIKSKQEIESKVGVNEFIKKCKEFAEENMGSMTKDFQRLGVWQSWGDPYYTFKNEYIEGVWFGLKHAHQEKLLYKGEKVLTWCARCATALAKHELEYKNIKENSIFVKFPLKKEEKTYLLIWTTTPWTIPLNLAVMVHPEFDYVKVETEDGENLIAAKSLISAIMGHVGKKFKIVEEFKGADLKGWEYKHPLEKEVPEQKEFKHKIVLSKDYVSLDAGSGLVHCAPGCGPEDYLIAKKNDLPIFSPVSESGYYEVKAGEYCGKFVKSKDTEKEILNDLKEKGVLLDEAKVEHEYPHCWRCKLPVIFRATKQWFIAASKLRNKMLKENKKVKWMPNWGGTWFNNWLEELDDWCISRQRFWGTPLPIWACKCGEFEVIGTVKELKKRARIIRLKDIDLHIPTINEFIFKCRKCKEPMHRIPDVLDVWIDSGAATWASLDYPSNKKRFEKNFPMDFILEGKDQIRGWFNSLMAFSLILKNQTPYKAVYMHGFTTDEKGRKFSKSLGNGVAPHEVIDKYGADVTRFYLIGATPAGQDIKFVWEEVKNIYKNMNVMWNTYRFIKQNMELEGYKHKEPGNLKIEDKWILSSLNTLIREVTDDLEDYNLERVPKKILDFFVNKFSRVYLKLVKDRLYSSKKKDKLIVLSVLDCVTSSLLPIFAIICPFLAEQMYQDLKQYLNEKAESVHLLKWPKPGRSNQKLEEQMSTTQDILQLILSAREKAGIGLRWPVLEIMIVGDTKIKKPLTHFQDLILSQSNIKVLSYSKKKPSFVRQRTVLNFDKLGPKYGQNFPVLARKVLELSIEYIQRQLEEKGKIKIDADGLAFNITKEDLKFEDTLPNKWIGSESKGITIYLNTEETEDLYKEGLTREMIRRVQDLRKKLKLDRKDQVKLFIVCSEDTEGLLEDTVDRIAQRTSSEIHFSRLDTQGDISDEFKIRDRKIKIAIKK